MAAGQTDGCQPGTGDVLAPIVHGRYSQAQIQKLWVAEGGDPSKALIASAIAMAESTGDPTATSANPAGGQNLGLWQIWDGNKGAALDPVGNAKAAIALSDNGQHWGLWETFTHRTYLTYMHDVSSPKLPVEQPATCGTLDPALGGAVRVVDWTGGAWPVPLPGFPGISCDPRIIPNLLALVRKYKLNVTACYAPTGHEAGGEHPLGLAVDLGPGPGGNWDLIDDLARWAGWTRACGASGVAPACPLKPIFRFVGYDGYPNHGRGDHLHLSWLHGPGRPASTVTVMGGG